MEAERFQYYHQLYAEFLQYLNDNCPDFDVKLLLSLLKTRGVINQNEYETIGNNGRGSVDRNLILFQQILPGKDEICHRELLTVFNNSRYGHFTEYITKIKDEINMSNSARALAMASISRHLQPNVISVVPNLGRVDIISDLMSAFSVHIEENYARLNRTNSIYEDELSALGNIPASNGVISRSMENMTQLPADINITDYYASRSKPKGLALLINNHRYAQYENRRGSYVDFANVHMLLNNLGYNVHCKIDQTAKEMENDAKEFVELFNCKVCGYCDSCIVVVMTYAIGGIFIGVDGEKVDQEAFFRTIMDSEILEGKPKIFIIQACRMQALNANVETKEGILSLIKKSEKETKQGFLNTIPDSDDTCILYSATPGYYSWKQEVKGSWFIEAVCDVISQQAHLPDSHLGELYRQIRNKVKEKFAGQRKFIVLPSMELTMNKKFHFFPGLLSATL